MVNELSLTGNDLICYALIWGFTQDGNFWEKSHTYISEWLGVSKRCVIDILKRLVKQGYLEKKDYEVNGVKFCKYRAVVANFTGSEDSAQGGSEDSSQCLINEDKKEKKEKEIIKEKEKEKDELFEQCWEKYRRKGAKGKAKIVWDKLSQEEKDHVFPHIKAYVSSRDMQYQKDFERYLRDKTFETIVISNNNVIYDPARNDSNEYRPSLTSQLLYYEEKKCYLYIGYFTGFIGDGYNDDNRPDGATIVLNNGRGTIKWSKEKRQWILTR